METQDLFAGVHIQTGQSIVPRDVGGNLVEARARRDRGMGRAISHADNARRNWSDYALGYVREYFARFELGTCEDIRKFASASGFAAPPDGRAWGGVMMGASKARLVTKAGWTTATDPKVHCNPVMQWRRA